MAKKCNGPCNAEKELSEFNPTNALLCNDCKEAMGEWQRTYCDGKHPRHDRDVYNKLPPEVDSILETLSTEPDDNLLQIIHEGMSMLIDRMEEKDGPMDVIDIPDGFVETCYMLTGHIKRLKKAAVEDICEDNIHSIKWKDSEFFKGIINDVTRPS